MTNPLAQDLGGVVLDRDLDVLPPWPAFPKPWATASVTYEEDGETCTQHVFTEKQLRAFAKSCAQLVLDSAEIAGALRDAERYRWLRSPAAIIEPLFGYDDAGSLTFFSESELDTAIDSAMQQGGGGE